MVATHVAIFYCPTRRAAQPYPHGPREIRNYEPPQFAAKSDYAANIGGDFAFAGMGTDVGPASLAAAETYRWQFSGERFVANLKGRYPTFDGMTGIIFQRSEVKISQITDGTSHTYVLGEKNLDANHYDDGVPGNDDQSMYNGYDRDNMRAAIAWYPGFENRSALVAPAVPDTPGTDYAQWNFGGPHPGGWVALFCDNSVRYLTYDMRPEVHQSFGSRKDGNVINLDEL
jgi:hypothetical protein